MVGGGTVNTSISAGMAAASNPPVSIVKDKTILTTLPVSDIGASNNPTNTTAVGVKNTHYLTGRSNNKGDLF